MKGLVVIEQVLFWVEKLYIYILVENVKITLLQEVFFWHYQ